MKKILFLVMIMGVFSCNQEEIKIKGTIKGAPDGQMQVYLKANMSGAVKNLDTITIENEAFKFYSQKIKPPVILSLRLDSLTEFDVWIGRYGSWEILGDVNKQTKVEVLGSLFNDEIKRINQLFKEQYIDPVKTKMEWVRRYEGQVKDGHQFSADEVIMKNTFEDDIKKSLKIRRKSIIKTVRTNPQSNIAFALIFEEYHSLIPRHQKEFLKLMRKKFGDTALYWQFSH